jgi:hypothetical protein
MVVYLGGSITWIQSCIHKNSYFAGTPRIMYSAMCKVRLCCCPKLQPLTRSFQSSHSQWQLNTLIPITHHLTRKSPVSFGILPFLNISFCYDCIVTTPQYPIQFWDLSLPHYSEHDKLFSPLFQLAFSDTQSEVLILLNKAQWKSFMGSAHMKEP